MQRRADIPGVVVLGDGYSTLGVVRSLGRRGIPTLLIDAVPRLAWHSRYVGRRYLWPGAMEGQDFVDFLLSLGRQESLRDWILLPCTDKAVEFAARYRPSLGAVYRMATPDWEVVRQATDKRLTYQLTQEVGIPYPSTWYPDSEAELVGLPLRYPAIVKPAMSSPFYDAFGVKALPAHTPAELRAQYRYAASCVGADELMIQEIIAGAGTEQFSVAAYARDGKLLHAMTARRLRQYPIDFGLRSSCVQAVEVPELLELGERLISGMRAWGMLELEFKRDARDGKYKLLDINLRPWAWHALCPACGLDFPYIQYRDLLGLPLEPATPTYGAHWLRALTDLPAGWQEIRAGRTTPGAYLRSLGGKTVFSAFDWRDPLPASHDLVAHVKRALSVPARPIGAGGGGAHGYHARRGAPACAGDGRGGPGGPMITSSSSATSAAGITGATAEPREQLPYWEQYYNDYPYGWHLSRVEERAVLAVRELVGREPASALDVGCEGGRWSRLLAERGWRLTCTDVSAEALAICQRRLPDAQCLLVDEHDTTLPSPDIAQQALLCIEVPMVMQSEWFLAEAARVLAPGGYLVGVHYNRQSLRGFLYNYVPGFRSKNDVAYFYFPESYAAWRRRLRAAGFEVIREDGFGWIPFRKYSRSPLIPRAVQLERTLGLTRLARFSPMVVFIARKAQRATGSGNEGRRRGAE